ncbi:hypothetical protein ACFO5K_25500, partial [Nocardia halotolerans]
MEWPEGNEDEMWAMAEDWRAAADSLRGLVDDIDDAKAAAFKAYPFGEGVDDMLAAFEGMARGDQSVTKLGELFDILGDSVYQTGTEIEYTKIMFLSSLALLALEIAAAWVFPPTAPAVQAAAVAVTRVVARTIFGRVLAAILRHGAKAVITRVLKFVGQHVAIDTALGTLQELGAQQWQVEQGHRKEVDWNQVKAAAVSSAAGGVAAGPFGNFLGRKLGDGMAPWLKGAITGTGAGLVGAGGGMLGQFGYEGFTQGWDKAWDNLQTAASDPLMWSAGASNGGISGLNKAGANTALSNMAPGLFNRPSFSSQIREAMGPGYDLGNFGLSDGSGAGNDGSATRPGAGDGRAGAGDDATGAGGDDGVRAGAGKDTMGGAGTDESRAGAGGDSQSIRPAGSSQSPEGAAQGSTNNDGGRADSSAGDDRQTTGGEAGVGRQESKPEAQNGQTQAGDGGRQEAGARAGGESPAAQAESGQDRARAGEAEQADGASAGEGTRTDAQSSDRPADRADHTQSADRNTTQVTGAPVGAGVVGTGPAAAAPPVPATGQAATPTAGASTAPSQSPSAPTQSNPGQQTSAGQQSTSNQGSQPAARPAGPDVRSGLPDRAQPGSDIRSSAPEVADRTSVGTPEPADARGAAEDSGAPTSRPASESRAGVSEQPGARVVDTPAQGLQAAPGEAPPTRTSRSEVTGEQVRAEDSEVRPEPDPSAAIPPVVPIVGADPGAGPARPGPDTARPGRAGADDPASPRDRADAGQDRKQPSPDENADQPAYDTRLPNGQGVVHHPTGTAIGEDARTHRVSQNVRNDGAHDVVVHGRRDGSLTPSNADAVHPRHIVDAIRSNPDYVPGTPVRLLACHSGNSKGWAQYIADQLGVDVTAPTDRVGVRREPDSDPVIDRGGKWRTFSPETASTTSETPTPRVDSDPPDTRDLDTLDGDRPPPDRELVDFMSDQDPPPTRPAAMTFLDPGTGTVHAPADRTPGIEPHLLGALDMNDPRVQTGGDPRRITHVDGEPIDDFSRRLSAERGQAFVDAARVDPEAVAAYDDHKARQEALEVQKSQAGKDVRDAMQRLKQARDALNNAEAGAADRLREAEQSATEAKDRAKQAKIELDQFLAADRAAAETGDSAKQQLDRAVADTLSAARRGNCSSVTIDRLTGRVYEAANGPSTQRIHPSDLHSTVRDNIARYQNPDDVYTNHDLTRFPHTDNPLGHAEVRGTNAAMRDRELLNQQRGPEDRLPTDHDGLSSILNSPFVPSRGVEAPCCANCTRVLQGTESTAGHIIDEGADRVPPLRHADLEQVGDDGDSAAPRLVSTEYPKTDFMGDDDDVVPAGAAADPVPPGMVRGDDGLLRRPGDRLDSYRDPDGTWHHVDDPAGTKRNVSFGLHGTDGSFVKDHLSNADYLYDALKGASETHQIKDPARAAELAEASKQRLALQTKRDGVRVKLEPLMAEFGIKETKELAPKRLTNVIESLRREIQTDTSLSPDEQTRRQIRVDELEDTARDYNDDGRKMIQASKTLGEVAGIDFALDPDARPGALLLSPFEGAFDGAGVVDIAAYVPRADDDSAPKLVIVEAKGVGSVLGGSKTAQAEQGSPEYLRRTLNMDRNLARILNETPDQMRARGIDPEGSEGRALTAAVADLRAAMADGTLQVEYRLVHTAADGKVTVTELLLRRDGVDVLADVPLPFGADPDALDRSADDDTIDYMDKDAEPPARPPTASSPEPEPPARNSSSPSRGLPESPAGLAVPGDAALDRPGADPGDPSTGTRQRSASLDDVHRFLRELSDLPPSAHADAPPLTSQQAEQVRRLAEALGLGDSLSRQRDPLGALAEIADMARARGFLDSALDPDAELGAPMRYPDDYKPLDADELQDGLDQWRVEGDPETRAGIADDLRRAGLEDDSRPPLGTEPEPDTRAQPLRPSAVLPPDDGTQQPGGSRVEPAQRVQDRLATRFGVDPADPGSLDAARYRQLLRAGAVEAFASAVRHAEAATEPQQRAVRAAVARRWAARLGLPADPGLTRALDDINRLRASVSRDAGDLAHLDHLLRTELDDRLLSLDVDGDKMLARLVADGPDTWQLEPIERPAPAPYAPTTEKAAEVAPKKGWLRRLWDRIANRGYYGDNPKYPSGSSIDSAGQSMLGHSAGLPLTSAKDSTPGVPGGEYDQLQVKFNPARILKEGLLMWQNRELVPILRHLSSRIADQAGEFLPLRNLDGSEYKP